MRMPIFKQQELSGGINGYLSWFLSHGMLINFLMQRSANWIAETSINGKVIKSKQHPTMISALHELYMISKPMVDANND